MRLPLAIVACLLVACSAPGPTGSEENPHTDVAVEPFEVPEALSNYVTDNHWGEHHIVWHGTRRWFIGGHQIRGWLSSISEKYAELQEGDAESGIEFMAMHAVMIEHLRERFADNDEVTTVLDGWRTDDELLDAVDAYTDGENKHLIEEAIPKVNDFEAFETEDDWGLFMQSALRITYEVDPFDTFQRFYRTVGTDGAGVHNTLHGIFSDSESAIDVNNHETNLRNVLFWGFHAWIDQKWLEFQDTHVRTKYEQELFDYHMARFRLHMYLLSPDAFAHEHVEAVPMEVVDAARTRLVSNTIRCEDLDESTQAEGCGDAGEQRREPEENR